MANDFEFTSVNELTVLRAANDANEIVIGKLANKGDLNSQQIRNVLNRMEFLARFFGSDLHGRIGKQAYLECERRQVGSAVKLLLNGGQRHIPRLLQMQNDFQAIDVLFGILAIPLGSTMRRNEPFVFQEANFGV